MFRSIIRLSERKKKRSKIYPKINYPILLDLFFLLRLYKVILLKFRVEVSLAIYFPFETIPMIIVTRYKRVEIHVTIINTAHWRCVWIVTKRGKKRGRDGGSSLIRDRITEQKKRKWGKSRDRRGFCEGKGGSWERILSDDETPS